MSLFHKGFEEVRRKRSIRVSCRLCGKRLTRIVSEWATISPFNVDEHRVQKTREQVTRDVEAKLKAKIADLERHGVICRACNEEPK